MRLKVLSLLLVVMILSSITPISLARSNGIHSSSGGCGCHYATSATVSISGQPASYNPGQTYTLTVSASGSISGNGGGFSLEVDKGTLAVPSVGIMSVKVNNAGKSATHTTSSYRSWDVDWTGPQAGSGVVQFDLAAMIANGNGGTSGDGWSTTSIQVPEAVVVTPNNPPSLSNLQITPANPYTTDTLSLNYTFEDQDGDSEIGSVIHWFRDNVRVTSLDNQTSVSPAFTQKGQTWNVSVTPSDGTDYGQQENLTNIFVINSPPVVQFAEILPENATDANNLSFTWQYSDADGDNVSISEIEWFLDGAKVSAFDGYMVIPSVAVRDGDYWYANIKLSDGESNSSWFSTASILIGSSNNAPEITSVTIDGLYKTVDDLEATCTATDIDNDILTYEWSWSNGVGSVNSTILSSTYTSKGQTWIASCRVSDGKVWSDWTNSQSVVIQNSKPILEFLEITQDTVYFENETEYNYTASDPDGDELFKQESWTREGDVLTLTLSIYDSEFGYSESLSDSVLIINSPPVVTYSGDYEFDSLSDLEPIMSASDANGDEVVLNWIWIRNGFVTGFNSSVIPSENIGAGDVWVSMVTPFDGEDNGTMLISEFTITNNNPIAVVSSADDLIQGAFVTFSAMDSVDEDGEVISAVWKVNGLLIGSGLTQSVLMSEELVIELTVTDNLGGTNTTEVTYYGIMPPTAKNLQASVKGNAVLLEWGGNAEEWAVMRNGELVEITSAFSFKDEPTLEGEHVYDIYPVIEEQVINIGTAESTANIYLEIKNVEEAPGPDTTFGLILSIVLILFSLTILGYSYLKRRD